MQKINATAFNFDCVMVSLIVVLLSKANTFDDRTESLSFGICGIVYANIVWKTSKLFEFINSLALADNIKACEQY